MCVKKEKGDIILKKFINVVVIDDNEVVTSNMKKYFLSSEKINIQKIFKDGKTGLDYLINNAKEYDIVIMDLLLPNIDGIAILEELNNKNISKTTIILSNYKDDYSVQRARSLGAAFYMLKPFSMESLEKRILDINKEYNAKVENANNYVELEISSLLHELGIPTHILGYQYLREGILYLYEHPRNYSLVTKDVYPAVAEKYDTTPQRVERAIRHAIEVSWVRGDLKLMESLFGNSIDFEKARPTNSEFLTTIADRLKINSKILIG